MKSAIENYEPFGSEWEKEMMKWSKPLLIAKLKSLLQQSPLPSAGVEEAADKWCNENCVGGEHTYTACHAAFLAGSQQGLTREIEIINTHQELKMLSPREQYIYNGMVMTMPNTAGWVLVDKSPRSVTFTANQKEQEKLT